MFYLGNGKLALISVFFSLLHECAHGVVAKGLGYSPKEIVAGLFGGVLHLEDRRIKLSDELLIHSAGPLFNLGVAAVGYVILQIFGWHWIYYIIAANLVLAFFNLMPFYPLDGGKILNVYFKRLLSLKASYIASKTLSIVFSILLFLFGLYLVQYNIVNLIVCALAINLFVAGRADDRYSFDRLHNIYSNLKEDNRI